MKLILTSSPLVCPTLTHWKICSWKFEVPRDSLGKPGSIDIWLARCFLQDGEFIESEMPGLNVVIAGAEFEEFIEISTTTQGLMDDSIQILGQFLIDKGYISGTLTEE